MIREFAFRQKEVRTTFRANVNGLSVAYERTGEGPALVLLHGFTHDSRVWRQQLESLSASSQSSRGTHRGQVSPLTPETFGTGDWADCLAGLLDAIGGSTGTHPRSFVGWSPRPGVLSALLRACAVACPGRYVRRVDRVASPNRSPRNAWQPACEMPHCHQASSCRGTCLGCSASPRRRKTEKSWKASCSTSTRQVSG